MMFARPLFALLAFTSTSVAYAACPMQKALIRGQVHSKDEPVADASIQITWDEQRTRDVSAETRTAADGSFELSLSIDSFAGRTILAKEKCGYMPEEFTVDVRHEGHRDFSQSYELKDVDKPLDIELRAR
jgi:hypothetical protein